MSTDLQRPIVVTYEQGTILLDVQGNLFPGLAELGLTYDKRVLAFRAEACRYRPVLESLVRQGIPFDDQARGWEQLGPMNPVSPFQPYPHQTEALAAWKARRRAGVVVLPTGSGKTYLAHMAIHECRRPTIVVVPTLDLVSQWVRSLQGAFGVEVGIIGGGEHTVQPLTVITYDSAARHMEHLGNRFGLIVFDECHHLPGPVYSYIARMSAAPFRLGLSATPERPDGGDELLEKLVGPIAYSSRVSHLAGDILAPYRTIKTLVDLTDEEQTSYEVARKKYLEFCRRRGVRFSEPGGWLNFLRETASSKQGRAAFEAYLLQRNIPLKSEAKSRVLEELLVRHRGGRVIIFTHVNELAYRISRRFLLPVITHQTPTRERADILERFGRGTYPAVVTSKVLNEGVDVPEANVGIIMSGSGSVREHVQRLGRLLRRGDGKEACLYEVVARGTHEESMSTRRRRHEAYRRGRGRRG